MDSQYMLSKPQLTVSLQSDLVIHHLLTETTVTSMRGGSFGSPQPHYAQSPYPQHHFPHQPHRTPSNSYAQLPHPHHQHMTSQHGLPTAVPLDTGDEAKA